MADVADRQNGFLVEPEPFSEASYFESVTAILSDVIPQSVGSKQAVPEKRDIVQWIRFEAADVSDVRLLMAEQGDLFVDVSAPQLLSIGYAVGFQLWLLLANGRAQQLVSDSLITANMLRVLRTPPLTQSSFSGGSKFAALRPIMAVVGEPLREGKQKAASTVLSFYSMRTNAHCHPQTYFKTDILDIQSNSRVIIVATTNKVSIMNSSTLEGMAVIRDCYTADGRSLNPIALGDKWLAYQNRKLAQGYVSPCRLNTLGEDTYTASVLTAAKTISQGVSFLGSMMTTRGSSSPPPTLDPADVAPAEVTAGVVTVLDLDALDDGENKMVKWTMADCAAGNPHVIAHFIAHYREPVVHMMFDRSECLLLTCSENGRNFHLFRLHPHCSGSVFSAVQHLYTLYRGDTEASVCHSAFSFDSRWLAVSTKRGTTHVFPISPYGGPIEGRTHTSVNVVNRRSRFETSAGLQDTYNIPADNTVVTPQPPTRGAAVGAQPAVTPTAASSRADVCTFSAQMNNALCLTHRRYLASSEAGLSVQPLAQIKHYTLLGSPAYGSASSIVSTATQVASTIRLYANQATAASGSGTTTRRSSQPSSPPAFGGGMCVATVFASPRYSRYSNPSARQQDTRRGDKVLSPFSESLFIMTSGSRLMEHRLDAHQKPSQNGSGPVLEFSETPLASWDLQRLAHWPDDPLPLSSTHILVRSGELAVQTSSSTAMLRAFSGLSLHEVVPERLGRSPSSHSFPIPSASGSVASFTRSSRSGSMSGAPANMSSSPPGANSASRSAAQDWWPNVEPKTHADIGRRIWMGPQFTYRRALLGNGRDVSPASGGRSPDSNSSSTATLPMEASSAVNMTSAYSERVQHQTLPIVMKSRRGDGLNGGGATATALPGSWQENMAEAYGSWPEVEPISGRSTDNQSMTSHDVELSLLDAMRDSSLQEESPLSVALQDGAVALGGFGGAVGRYQSIPVAVPSSPERVLIVQRSFGDGASVGGGSAGASGGDADAMVGEHVGSCGAVDDGYGDLDF